MGTVVTMPRYGANMEEGTVSEWFFDEGASVAEGDPLCEIEIEKLSNELETPAEGVLRKIFCPEGGTRECGAPIAIIAGEDEDIAPLLAQAEGAAADGKEAASEEAGADGKEAAPEEAGAGGQSTASEDKGPGKAAVAEGTDGGATAEAGVSSGGAPKTAPKTAPKITPKARKLAEQEGVDYAGIKGTGIHGAITRQDVKGYIASGISVRKGNTAEEAAAAQAAGAGPRGGPATPPGAGIPSGPGTAGAAVATDRDFGRDTGGQTVPMSSVRRATARAMMRSVSETAQTTIMMDAQVDEMVRRYGAAKENFSVEGGRISYTAAALKAVAETLVEYPEIRTVAEGEDKIRTLENIDVGVAVDLGNGLMVPVLRGCGTKNLKSLSRDLSSLVDRARAGSLGQDDFGGAAISVSNVGMYGVRYFTPILNPPESAIVGLGTLQQEPVIRNGGIFPAWIFSLNMTYDHRIIDGAPAARFLAAVGEKLNWVIPEHG